MTLSARLVPNVLVVLIVAVGGVVGLACSRSMLPPDGGARVGHPVRFSLPSDDGRLVHVPMSAARSTVLDFFSPSCEPCRQKVPALVAKQDALRQAGATLVLIGVLSDSETTENARAALESWGVKDIHFLVDRGGVSQSEAGVRDLPATLVLDGSGGVRWIATPEATAEDVVDAAR